MRRSSVCCLAALTCLFCLTSLGCGSGNPATAKVTGTVTVDGQPIQGAVVVFHPATGRAATGVTDAAGKFALTTFEGQDGALPGEHKVAISKPPENEPMPGTPEAENYKPEAAIDVTYSNPETSGLTATVDINGANDFTFEVKK